ncbi:unnamed protein product [Lampetra planeri]
MVLHVRGSNFSTTDSSLSGPVQDSSAPQSPGGLSRTGHTVVAVCLGCILVAGILSNLLTLLIFAKFRCRPLPVDSHQRDPVEYQPQRHPGVRLRDPLQLRGQFARQVAHRRVRMQVVRVRQFLLW